MFNAQTWHHGEALAAEFLKRKKYKILAQNYKTKLGEIDIIAKFKKTFVFIEVKARQDRALYNPREAVTSFKQDKIRQVATQFLIENKVFPSSMRFDVVEVVGDEICHIENAF